MSLVLDASMAIAWIFDDESTETVRRIMTRVTDGGAVVPSLWRLEVANVLRIAVRRKRCNEEFASTSLGNLALLPITIDSETALHGWGATLQLARECALTLYDAAYLELALRMSVPLASCDAALLRAATRKGAAVFAG